jgi:hypothetical protein
MTHPRINAEVLAEIQQACSQVINIAKREFYKRGIDVELLPEIVQGALQELIDDAGYPLVVVAHLNPQQQIAVSLAFDSKHLGGADPREVVNAAAVPGEFSPKAWDMIPMSGLPNVSAASKGVVRLFDRESLEEAMAFGHGILVVGADAALLAYVDDDGKYRCDISSPSIKADIQTMANLVELNAWLDEQWPRLGEIPLKEL